MKCNPSATIPCHIVGSAAGKLHQKYYRHKRRSRHPAVLGAAPAVGRSAADSSDCSVHRQPPTTRTLLSTMDQNSARSKNEPAGATDPRGLLAQENRQRLQKQ